MPRDFRCVFHHFDKTTHRCTECARYERGFAPKREVKKPKARGECQICECNQAIKDNGKIVHHGYKRPGWGYIEGDCFGVGYKSFPETDALEIYLEHVVDRIASLTRLIRELPDVTFLFVSRYNKEKRDYENVRINKADIPDFQWQHQIYLQRSDLEWNLKSAEKERTRVEARIVLGKAKER